MNLITNFNYSEQKTDTTTITINKYKIDICLLRLIIKYKLRVFDDFVKLYLVKYNIISNKDHDFPDHLYCLDTIGDVHHSLSDCEL